MSATYVYVISAADDTLYVGHTKDLFQRLRQHRREPWADRVTHVQGYVFAKKADALRAERNFIADLEPNVQGNPRHLTWDQHLSYIGAAA